MNRPKKIFAAMLAAVLVAGLLPQVATMVFADGPETVAADEVAVGQDEAVNADMAGTAGGQGEAAGEATGKVAEKAAVGQGEAANADMAGTAGKTAEENGQDETVGEVPGSGTASAELQDPNENGTKEPETTPGMQEAATAEGGETGTEPGAESRGGAADGTEPGLAGEAASAEDAGTAAMANADSKFAVQAVQDGNIHRAEEIDTPVAPGSSITLEAEVTEIDIPSTTYQWSKNGEPINGATKATYETGPITGKCEYRVDATDKYGNTEDTVYAVYVKNNLEVIAKTDVPAVPGSSVTLKPEVYATDKEGITYQWSIGDGEVRYEPISGATGAEYETGPVIEACKYRVDVTDRYGNTAYAEFNIFIGDVDFEVYPGRNEDGTLRVYQLNMHIAPGSSVTLKPIVKAADMESLTYRWSKNGEPISGATKAAYETGPVAGVCRYSVEVTDKYGNVKSASYQVCIENNFKVEGTAIYGTGNLAVQVDMPAAPGSSVTLKPEVSATDMAGTTYQWSKNGQPIEGAAGATYETGPVTEACRYVVTVTDKYGNAGSVAYQVHPGDLEVYAGRNGQGDLVDTIVIHAEPGAKVTLAPIVSSTEMDGITYSWMKTVLEYVPSRSTAKARIPEAEHSGIGGGGGGAAVGGLGKSTIIEDATGASYTTDPVTEWARYGFTAKDKHGNSKTVYFYVYEKKTVSGEVGVLQWTLDTDGILTIAGEGYMHDFDDVSARSYLAWRPYYMDIKNVIICNGVKSIGYGAFMDCGSLESISLPDTVRLITDMAFMDCSSLKDVYYAGTEAQAEEIDNRSGFYFENAIWHYSVPYSEILEGQGQTVKNDGKEKVVFRTSAPVDTFVKLVIDGQELVKDADFTVTEGSTIITLAPEYVAKLGSGIHKVEIVSKVGTVMVDFTVEAVNPEPETEPADPTTASGNTAQGTVPSTGDGANAVLYVLAAAIALLAAGFACGRRKRSTK